MTQSKILRIAALVALALTVIGFGGAGLAKLAGVEEVHKGLAEAGWPGFSGYVIGALEVAGVIGLFIKPLRSWAASGLVATAIGAFAFHVAYPPIAEGIPALVLLGCSAFVLYGFRRLDPAV